MLVSHRWSCTLGDGGEVSPGCGGGVVHVEVVHKAVVSVTPEHVEFAPRGCEAEAASRSRRYALDSVGEVGPSHGGGVKGAEFAQCVGIILTPVDVELGRN